MTSKERLKWIHKASSCLGPTDLVLVAHYVSNEDLPESNVLKSLQLAMPEDVYFRAKGILTYIRMNKNKTYQVRVSLYNSITPDVPVKGSYAVCQHWINSQPRRSSTNYTIEPV
jgi:hypothetical protein